MKDGRNGGRHAVRVRGSGEAGCRRDDDGRGWAVEGDGVGEGASSRAKHTATRLLDRPRCPAQGAEKPDAYMYVQ